MSKRRKYDGRNKRSFIIIVVLAVIIICIFSLFIYKYSKISKIEYVIEAGTVLQDDEKNYITLDDDAVLKIRWNKDYYLVYNDEKVDLGDNVIAYNTITGSMKLYGNFYEINSDGKIIELKDENLLPNTTNCKFYKLDDREYLLVDSKISSSDRSIDANSYLLVELDKAGNAKLSNNKVNLKTISPTTLMTSKYSFDIANEILRFGEYEIDLKKIIGSTNQYVPEEEKDKNNNDDNGTDSNIDNDYNVGIGAGIAGGAGNIVNNNDIGNKPDVEEVLDKIKMTSVIRIVEGITQIDIDYVIYDPYNEYHFVYVEVISAGKSDKIYLSKTDTHLTISDLYANTDYKLNFVYVTSVVDEDTGEEDVSYTTFDSFDLTTKMPQYNISIYKISYAMGSLKYKIDLQEGFKTSKVYVRVMFDYEVYDEELDKNVTKTVDELFPLETGNNSLGYVIGDFNISGYKINSNTLINLKIEKVLAYDKELEINKDYSFKFGSVE